MLNKASARIFDFQTTKDDLFLSNFFLKF